MNHSPIMFVDLQALRNLGLTEDQIAEIRDTSDFSVNVAPGTKLHTLKDGKLTTTVRN